MVENEKVPEAVNSNELTEICFQLASLRFTPYNDDKASSSTSILFDVVTFLSNELLAGQGYLVDRHQNNSSSSRRELFLTRAVIMHKEKKMRCSIALLRTGKIPKLKPAESYKLVTLDIAKGAIAEETHFFVDFSKSIGILCVEYNYHGPRISDIEYYLRHIAKHKLKSAKATQVDLYMERSIDYAFANLKNVLNIDIKVQPEKLAKLDTALVGQYFTIMTTFGQKIKPKFVRVEALFQTPGKTTKSDVLNKDANNMVLTLLSKFKSQPENIDCFENFVVQYKDSDGEDQVFDLLKGKKEIIVEVDLKTQKPKDIYELIKNQFNEFVESI